MRVVLDTNTVLSTLLFPRGRLAWIRETWTGSRTVPLVCNTTIREFIRTLAYPKLKAGQAPFAIETATSFKRRFE